CLSSVGCGGGAFRFFQPAPPVGAGLGAVGVVGLRGRWRLWLPAFLLAAGVLWNVPAVATDLLGGYGYAYAGTAANWQLDAYPPVGAWRFLHHLFPANSLDSEALDIIWFRATRFIGWVAIIPFGVAMTAAIAFWLAAVRRLGPTPA